MKKILLLVAFFSCLIRISYSQTADSNAKIEGTLGQYLSNENFIICGFTLNTASGTVNIHFYTEWGKKIYTEVKPGNKVMVTGTYSGSNNDRYLNLVTLKLNGNEIILYEPGPKAEDIVNLSGRVTELKVEGNKVERFVIDNKIAVYPGKNTEVPSLKEGNNVAIKGNEFKIEDTEMQLKPMRIVIAEKVYSY